MYRYVYQTNGDTSRNAYFAKLDNVTLVYQCDVAKLPVYKLNSKPYQLVQYRNWTLMNYSQNIITALLSKVMHLLRWRLYHYGAEMAQGGAVLLSLLLPSC